MSPRHTLAEWEEAFKAADKDNSGTLEMSELRDMMKKNNSHLTDSQLADIFVYFDGAKGDKRITLEEFVKGLNKLDAFIKKLKELFDKFDEDKSGYLDKGELRKILESSGHKFTEAEMEDILKGADSSGDGKISFNEFLDACT